MDYIRRLLKGKKTHTQALPSVDHEDSSKTNKPTILLETDDGKRERLLSLKIVYFTMFLMSLGFSIILTGIWPYLDKLDPHAGKEFMGLIVAANPFGQMLFSPLFGWWSNKMPSIRIPMLTSVAFYTIASGVYSGLYLIPTNVKYWMLGARFLVGVSSANVAVCRSYISAATTLKERTSAVSMVSLAQVLGFVIGPALQAAVTPLGDKGFTIFNGLLQIDMYTASAWINVMLGLVNFVLFFPFIFKDHRIAAREMMISTGKETEKETWKAIKPDYKTSWILIIVFFVIVFNFVLLETLATSLIMDQFAWSKEQALKNMGLLMSVGAVVACVTFVLIGPLTRRFKESNVLIWGGFFLMSLGRFVNIPFGTEMAKLALPREEYLANLTAGYYNETFENTGCPVEQDWCNYTPGITVWQFFMGYAFTSISYPIAVTLIQTIFSKILGPRPQGVWMGLMTGSGCLSRVMGPVFVGLVYTRYGTFWTFSSTTVMMILPMIWLYLVRDKLQVPEQGASSIDDAHIEDGAEMKLREDSNEDNTKH